MDIRKRGTQSPHFLKLYGKFASNEVALQPIVHLYQPGNNISLPLLSSSLAIRRDGRHWLTLEPAIGSPLK
jgi:hypothetical protein